jgi:hypothetical protein
MVHRFFGIMNTEQRNTEFRSAAISSFIIRLFDILRFSSPSHSDTLSTVVTVILKSPSAQIKGRMDHLFSKIELLSFLTRPEQSGRVPCLRREAEPTNTPAAGRSSADFNIPSALYLWRFTAEHTGQFVPALIFWFFCIKVKEQGRPESKHSFLIESKSFPRYFWEQK